MTDDHLHLGDRDLKRELSEQWRVRDSALRAMGLDGYESYLLTAHWRALVCALRSSSCVRCGSRAGLALHHVTYERLGRESPHDLRTLCSRCHELVHAFARRGLCSLDPATLAPDVTTVTQAPSVPPPRRSSGAGKRRRKSARPKGDRYSCLHVACPTCGAQVGEMCRVPSGKPRRSHAARRASPVDQSRDGREQARQQYGRTSEPVELTRDQIIKQARRSQFPLERMRELRDRGLL